MTLLVNDNSQGLDQISELKTQAIQRDTATVSSVVVTNLKTVFRKGGVDRVEVNILTCAFH